MILKSGRETIIRTMRAILVTILITMFVNSATAGLNEVLIKAAEHGEIYSVKATIDNGADVNTKMNDGMTPLMYSSMGGYLEIVRILITFGANVNARTIHGVTPIMYASLGGHLEIVRALIAKGADVNAMTNDGKTVLMLASTGVSLEIVTILLGNGADATFENKDGLTAQEVASIKGHKQIEELLKEAGKKVKRLPPSAKPVEESPSIALPALAADDKKQEQKRIFYTLLAGESVDRTKLDILLKRLKASGLSPVVRKGKKTKEVYRLVTECFNEKNSAQKRLTSLVRKEKQAFIVKDGDQHCVVAASGFSFEAALVEQNMLAKNDIRAEIVKAQVPLVVWEVTVGDYNDSQSAEVELKRLAERGINAVLIPRDK